MKRWHNIAKFLAGEDLGLTFLPSSRRWNFHNFKICFKCMLLDNLAGEAQVADLADGASLPRGGVGDADIGLWRELVIFVIHANIICGNLKLSKKKQRYYLWWTNNNPTCYWSIVSWKIELWKDAASSHRFIQDGLPSYDFAIAVSISFTSILEDVLP